MSNFKKLGIYYDAELNRLGILYLTSTGLYRFETAAFTISGISPYTGSGFRYIGKFE